MIIDTSLISLLHNFLLPPFQEFPDQTTDAMSSLPSRKLDFWPLYTLREDDGSTSDGSQVGVFLGGERTNAHSVLELGGTEDGGVRLGDTIEIDLDFDGAFWDISLGDRSRTGGEGIVDKQLASEGKVNAHFVRGDLLAVNMLGKSISHIGTLEEMTDEEQAEQAKDDASEDATTTGLGVAESVIARRSIFSQTARSTAGFDTTKDTARATTRARVLLLFLSILLHGKGNSALLRDEKWRLLVVERIRWEWGVVGHC